ncbi:MAG: hypothetical protein IT384_30295 [Deltaproteobacteria bacterium]|nr:hypothetical protein [Deltaproteobacteria bacterium]
MRPDDESDDKRDDKRDEKSDVSPTPKTLPIGPGSDLLLLLHALVLRDRAPAGFRGTIAVGVEEGGHQTWWCLHAGDQVRAELGSAPPSGADVELLLGAGEALTALVSGAIDQEYGHVRFRGNRRLFERFVERYVIQQNVVGLRAGQKKTWH